MVSPAMSASATPPSPSLAAALWSSQEAYRYEEAAARQLADDSVATGRALEEERLLQEALALSVVEAEPPPPPYVDDEDELARVIRMSEELAKKEHEKEAARRRSEDASELFQAALRASRVDLGPRGVSQAAKIFHTGDATLGQAAVVERLGTHTGAGGRHLRKTCGESADGVAVSIARSSSSVALRRNVSGAALPRNSTTSALPSAGALVPTTGSSSLAAPAAVGALSSSAASPAGAGAIKIAKTSQALRGAGLAAAATVKFSKGSPKATSKHLANR